jgi:aromatic ring-opening dioxygenase LigB subunit
MTLAYACIAPHGSEAIEHLANARATKKFQQTREGLRQLASEIKRARPDTIIIASPHNLKLWRNIGVVVTENSSGVLKASQRSNRSVSLKVKCDVDFAWELLRRSIRARLPVVAANYGTAEGVTSDMPMDWGTLVPLWFAVKEKGVGCKAVIVTPSREIPLVRNFDFGRMIADLAEKKPSRYVFIASADQAHTHRASGPYGFSRRAVEYDRFVVEAIEKNRVSSIMNLKQKFIDKAKPDSLWQMTILAGILSRVQMRAELVTYQAPTYFGMICAGFHRAN